MILEPTKKTARIAGTLYLLLAFTGMFGILYVPSQIIVAGDAAATARNIMANELLYRIGILSQLACQVLFVYLVLALHRLLSHVNEYYARQMVALVVVSVPIAFVNVINQLAALILLGEPDFLKVFETDQLAVLSIVFFKLYEHGTTVVEIFWGLWLIPFGLLVFRSRFIPRVFGVFLIIGGIGYVIASIVTILLVPYAETMSTIATLPSAIAEFSIIFWLLIKGVKAIPEAKK